MGLDMYLYKKTYVKNWNHTPKEHKFSITIKKGGKKFEGIKKDRISEITEQVGYWRKFNALHSWFVQNCADGVDDCRPMYVSNEQMKELLDTLKKVVKVLDKSEKKKSSVVVGWKGGGVEIREDIDVYDTDEVEDLLPTAPGFFFGGTEYDNYYYQSVSNTITLIEEVMAEGDADYYYEASW
jgi:hypothetical protein